MKSESVNAFLRVLHQKYLKPLGYTKTRHTFTRVFDEYTERIQIQGSAWNEAKGPWTFYVNFGIAFHDLPPRTPCRDFPGTHIWWRVQDLVPRCPAQYKFSHRNSGALAEPLAKTIARASVKVESQIRRHLASYEKERRLIAAYEK